MSDLPPSASQRELKKTTLAALGSVLPVGILSAGTLRKSFTLKPFRLKEEKILQDLRSRDQRMVMARYASQILVEMLTEVGGHDFTKMDAASKLLVIQQMYMADVMYVYMFLRREAMGELLKLPLSCKSCKQMYPFTADLNTLEVAVVDDPALLRRVITLRTGFDYRGKTVRTLYTGPTRWSTMDSRSTAALGQLKVATIQDSIVGIEGTPPAEFSPLTESQLEMMTKRDLEQLMAHTEAVAPGPLMVVEAVHQMNDDGSAGCQARQHQILDWSYDNFFGSSSL